MSPGVEGESLVRVYDEGGVRALDGVSIAVPIGEAVAVVGPSGSGKTTLLALLGTLDRPTSGVVRVLGDDAARARARARLRAETIGFAFQQHHMLAALTLAENVEIPLHGLGVPARERRERALRALEAVGLADRARHRPTRVSGGERQRAAIARALVTAPRVILADEPTGSVDSGTGAKIMDLLLAPVRLGDAALVVVTHNADIAARCDRVIRLRDGRVADGEAATT
ncbi:MAG: ATP-binding cassette domain-containing protein [Planctomycetales bacterium]|nr:ATP-binding cassette domain-containing protein [Planctomycetales bacterium]